MAFLHKACCAIAGQNPNVFSFGFNENDSRCKSLKSKLLQQIEMLCNEGIQTFFSDCSLGVSMWSAEIITDIMLLHSGIELICVIPYEEQAANWSEEYRDRYYLLHEKSTESILLKTSFTNKCIIECHRYLVTRSGILLAVRDHNSLSLDTAGYMAGYAAQTNRQVIFIHPMTLAVTRIIPDKKP